MSDTPKSAKETPKLNFTKEQAEAICHQFYLDLKKIEEFIVRNRETYENIAKNEALSAITGPSKDRPAQEERAKTYKAVSEAYDSMHKTLCRMSMDDFKRIDDWLKM